MTARQIILNHYETALKTLDPSVLKSVKLNKLDTRDIKDTKLPGAWVFSGAERRADFRMGKEYWDWDITVQVWAHRADMEELLNQVNTALYTRWVAEEFAEVWYRKTAELFVVDSDHELQGWSIVYKNSYLTDKGAT